MLIEQHRIRFDEWGHGRWVEGGGADAGELRGDAEQGQSTGDLEGYRGGVAAGCW